jgi:hypothetical protein
LLTQCCTVAFGGGQEFLRLERGGLPEAAGGCLRLGAYGFGLKSRRVQQLFRLGHGSRPQLGCVLLAILSHAVQLGELRVS